MKREFHSHVVLANHLIEGGGPKHRWEQRENNIGQRHLKASSYDMKFRTPTTWLYSSASLLSVNYGSNSSSPSTLVYNSTGYVSLTNTAGAVNVSSKCKALLDGAERWISSLWLLSRLSFFPFYVSSMLFLLFIFNSSIFLLYNPEGSYVTIIS